MQCFPDPLIPANGFSCSTACKPVAQRDAAQRRHHELVVVRRDVRLLEARRHLELTRRDFVVSRHDRHAQAIELVLDFGDARLNALGNAAEVVILELLSARRRRADERPAGHHEIGPHREVRAVDEEILLLGAERGVDAIHALVAEQLEQLDGLGGQRVGAAQQRSRLVERFAVVADEHRRNAQRLHAGPSRR